MSPKLFALAVYLLEQVKHREDAEQKKRDCEPRCVIVEREMRNPRQHHQHQKEHDRNAAALYKLIASITSDKTPEEERV